MSSEKVIHIFEKFPLWGKFARGFTVVLSDFDVSDLTIGVQMSRCSCADSFSRKKGVEVAKSRPPVRMSVMKLNGFVRKAVTSFSSDKDFYSESQNWAVQKALSQIDQHVVDLLYSTIRVMQMCGKSVESASK